MTTLRTISDHYDGFDEFWEGYLYGIAFTATEYREDDENYNEPIEEWSNPGGDIMDVTEPVAVQQALEAAGPSYLNDAYSSCLGFFSATRHLRDDVSDHDAGSDFHLSRNGHGSGFFDRGYEHSDLLQELASVHGTFELIRYVLTDGSKEWDVHK